MGGLVDNFQGRGSARAGWEPQPGAGFGDGLRGKE